MQSVLTRLASTFTSSRTCPTTRPDWPNTWGCFSRPCSLARAAGFSRLYSLFDLMRRECNPQKTLAAWSSRTAPQLIQRPVWARAFALVQRGEAIVMLKRPA